MDQTRDPKDYVLQMERDLKILSLNFPKQKEVNVPKPIEVYQWLSKLESSLTHQVS